MSTLLPSQQSIQQPKQESNTNNEPSFLTSLTQLKNLSSSITTFYNCYTDLQTHLDTIKFAIFSNPKPIKITSLPLQHQLNELETLFKTMDARQIRKYLIFHRSNITKLRKEIPMYLKLAPNPPKLVLTCLGKFFLQGKNAYTKNSPFITSREASLLALECFLLMGVESVEVEENVRVEAENSALDWKKRLEMEGRLRDATEADAKGVLLLIAGFGVPEGFRKEDVWDLVKVVRTEKEFVRVLKKSRALMDKITEIVEWLMKRKMEVEAVDIVYTFGLDESFNPQVILISYLQESTKSPEKPERASHRSAVAALNESNKKQLDALKSVRRCLKRHEVDPAKLLPGWQITEKILTLEKEVSTSSRISDEKPYQKRKAKELQTPNKSKTKEPKRSHYSNQHPSPYKHTTPLLNYSASPSGGPGVGLLLESMISTSPYTSRVHEGVLIDSPGEVLNRSQDYAYDAALVEKYANLPMLGLTGLSKGPASSSGVPTPSVDHVGLSSGPELYQFADSVVDREQYGSSFSHGAGTVSRSLPGSPSCII